MTDDNENEKIFLKLNYYLSKQSPIHFKLKSGDWRNAHIRSIDKENEVVLVKEFKLGDLQYFFFDIEADSIMEYVNREVKK